jgi:hypothetical protein
MNKKELIEQEIQKTLQYFDEGERLVVDAYFYVRLKTKLNQKETRAIGFSMERIVNAVMRPSFILLLLIFNIFTAFMIYVQLENQIDVKEQYLKTFASQFTITGSYDIFGYSDGGE